MTHEIIISGFGGQGVLSMGKILAYSGLMEDKEVTWMPAYGPEQRGGTANVTVIVSDEPVSSPILSSYDTAIVLNPPSLEKFACKVKPGGVLVINSSIIDRKAERDDIKVVYCDAQRIAEDIKNPKGANVAILGSLMAAEPIVSDELMAEAIRIELGERKAKFLPGNMKALEAGKAAAADQV